MVEVDVFHHKTLELLFTIECPFEYEDLVESLQYNGYTVQAVDRKKGQEDVVLETAIAK